MGIKATLIDNEAIKFVFLQFSSGSFTLPAIGGNKYFITFIDDHSHYGFIELIREKSYYFETFSKQKLSSNKGRISKLFILTYVVSIMVDMMRWDATWTICEIPSGIWH